MSRSVNNLMSTIYVIWVKDLRELHNYDQVVDYLDDKKLLYIFHLVSDEGFLLIHLFDYISFNKNKGNLIGMVLLDLQKAFDTVDHGILLMKLEAIGLTGDAIRWFQT